MRYDDLISAVVDRAHLPGRQEAVTAIRATLTVLASRLTREETRDLAAQLPREIGFYLQVAPGGPERLSLDEFLHRVSSLEHTAMQDAVYHARVVMEVLSEAVSAGEWSDVRAQLPQEYDALFGGSNGPMYPS